MASPSCERTPLSPATPAHAALADIAASDACASVDFVADGVALTATRADLHRLVAMGLGELPIEAIGMPCDEPPLCEPQAAPPLTLDISRRLTAYFPAYVAAALYEMQSLLRKGELRAYVIGGNIRDLLLYDTRLLDIQDVDLTIEGSAIAASQFIMAHSRNFNVEACYPDFGTVTLVYKDALRFDLASTRIERYATCGALPEVIQRGVPLAHDVVRRDFTVNALAMAVHDLGVILDHTGGMADITARRIRPLHAASFWEDPSRILRAFKFLTRLEFELSPGAERLVRQFLTYGDRVYHGGGERIKHELRKFCEAAETPVKQRWMAFFRDTGCVRLVNMTMPAAPSASVAPGGSREECSEPVACYWRHYALLHDTLGDATLGPDFRWRLFLCFLFGNDTGPAFLQTAHRLGLTRLEREQIVHYRQVLDLGGLERIQESSSPYDVYAVCHERPLSSMTAAAVVQYDTQPARLHTVLQALKAYRDKYANQRPELNGDDLLDLGVSPGEAIGQMLRELLKLKLMGRVKDRLSEVRYVRQCLGLPALPEASAGNGSDVPEDQDEDDPV